VNQSAPIYVAGGNSLVGNALRDHLRAIGYRNLVGVPPHEPDLTCPGQVEDFFAEFRPQYVFVTAGASGGIQTNRDRPAELMLDNLLSTTHVIQQAHRYQVTRLLYLASSCIYPKIAPQPLRVESLMTGPLEPTNEAYATAKLAGLQLCQAYRRQYGVDFLTAIPANPFGPYDDFRLDSGHVIPALMQRMHLAKIHGEDSLTLWGTGQPVRDFIYSRDLANACVFVMQHYRAPEPINIGHHEEHSIAATARILADVVGYRGKLCFDPHRPDGMPRKVLDAQRLQGLGWRPATDFRTALEETYAWFIEHDFMEEIAHVRTTV
jgi:GDP-L-fucose synthase